MSDFSPTNGAHGVTLKPGFDTIFAKHMFTFEFVRLHCIFEADRARFVHLYIDFFQSLDVFIGSRRMLYHCYAIHALEAKLEGVFEI